jgi:hypothetical protein
VQRLFQSSKFNTQESDHGAQKQNQRGLLTRGVAIVDPSSAATVGGAQFFLAIVPQERDRLRKIARALNSLELEFINF